MSPVAAVVSSENRLLKLMRGLPVSIAGGVFPSYRPRCAEAACPQQSPEPPSSCTVPYIDVPAASLPPEAPAVSSRFRKFPSAVRSPTCMCTSQLPTAGCSWPRCAAAAAGLAAQPQRALRAWPCMRYPSHQKHHRRRPCAFRPHTARSCRLRAFHYARPHVELHVPRA